MHKVLKDYLETSRGDLLRVVQRIKEMILNQYNKYRKDIATARHTIKFEHKLDAMPFLPPGIHNIVTPPAIEQVRQQELLRQQHYAECRIEPCTGGFRKIYGLPCSHSLQQMRNLGSTLHLNHFDDDHWRYESIDMSPRPHERILEPLAVPGRGRPRRDEASTRRDPSAFELPVPPTAHQSPPRSLAEILQETITALPSIQSLFLYLLLLYLLLYPYRISPVAVSPPSTFSSPNSSISISVSVPVSITMTPSQQPPQQPPEPSRTYPPTLEEFIADIERRRSQTLPRGCQDPNSLASYLAETGQEDDPVELVNARDMALATTGLFASCTPKMAWNCVFGDKEAFYAERFAQVQAQNLLHHPNDPDQRPKRAAAQKASAAWDELHPRKRRRRQ
jgi:hypothetical protein